MVAAPAGGVTVAAGAVFCNAKNLRLERVDDGHELSSGWSGSSRTCLTLSNGDYGCGWLKLLGAFLDATNLSE
jgi:hypothetical protein